MCKMTDLPSYAVIFRMAWGQPYVFNVANPYANVRGILFVPTLQELAAVAVANVILHSEDQTQLKRYINRESTPFQPSEAVHITFVSLKRRTIDRTHPHLGKIIDETKLHLCDVGHFVGRWQNPKSVYGDYLRTREWAKKRKRINTNCFASLCGKHAKEYARPQGYRCTRARPMKIGLSYT
jgi:hypothetical protein